MIIGCGPLSTELLKLIKTGTILWPDFTLITPVESVQLVSGVHCSATVTNKTHFHGHLKANSLVIHHNTCSVSSVPGHHDQHQPHQPPALHDNHLCQAQLFLQCSVSSHWQLGAVWPNYWEHYFRLLLHWSQQSVRSWINLEIVISVIDQNWGIHQKIESRMNLWKYS